MKRFTSIEIGGFVLAALFLFCGLDAVIWPQSGVVPHFTNDVWGMSPRTDMEVVSITGARIYGVLAILLGVGIAIIAIYREKK